VDALLKLHFLPKSQDSGQVRVISKSRKLSTWARNSPLHHEHIKFLYLALQVANKVLLDIASLPEEPHVRKRQLLIEVRGIKVLPFGAYIAQNTTANHHRPFQRPFRPQHHVATVFLL
jgi:hypothetical protein